MNQINKLLNESDLLFYGELEWLLYDKLLEVLEYCKSEDKYSATTHIFDKGTETTTALEFWLILSTLNSINFIDYGISPRFAWLTDEGTVLLRELKKLGSEGFKDYEVDKVSTLEFTFKYGFTDGTFTRQYDLYYTLYGIRDTKGNRPISVRLISNNVLKDSDKLKEYLNTVVYYILSSDITKGKKIIFNESRQTIDLIDV